MKQQVSKRYRTRNREIADDLEESGGNPGEEMIGYTGKLQGRPNDRHIISKQPPCSKPMPNGTGEGAPTWSSRSYDPPSSQVDIDAYRNKCAGQEHRMGKPKSSRQRVAEYRLRKKST